MVNQLFHVGFHTFTRRRCHLVVFGDHRARILAQPINTLLDSTVRLAHSLPTHQVAIIAITIDTNRHIEVHLVVRGIRLLLAQIPRNTLTTQHCAGKAHLQRALRSYHVDVDQSLLPDTAVSYTHLDVYKRQA